MCNEIEGYISNIKMLNLRIKTTCLCVASSMTLWLLESPLKHIFYLFEVAPVLTVNHSLLGNFEKTMFEIKEKATLELIRL